MMIRLKQLLQKPELVFAILTSFFGGISVFLMPILETPDENQHFQVAYSVLSENKGPAEDLQMEDGGTLKSIQQGEYSKYFSEVTSARDDGITPNPETFVFGSWAKGSIFDITRLPQAIGILFARLIEPSVWFMVIMGRLINLAVFILAAYFIIKFVNHGKWVFAFLATTPMMIQQAASLSYDPMNLLAIFAWIAFIINVSTQKSAITRKQLVIGALLTVFLLVNKLNNALLLLLILAVPMRHIIKIATYQRLESLKGWRFIRIAILTLAVATFFFGLYLMSVKLLAGQGFYPMQLLNVLLNTFLWGNLSLIDAVTIGMIGQFSNFYYHIPGWVVVITFIVLTLIMMLDTIPKASKKFAAVSGLLFVASVLLISIGMYYGWAMKPDRLGPGADVTDGIQGRYFTPLLLLLLPVISYWSRFLKLTARSKSTLPLMTISTSILLLSIYLLQTWRFFWS